MKSKTKSDDFIKNLKEAQKDPNFIKEINKFIKIASSHYKLKDYGLN